MLIAQSSTIIVNPNNNVVCTRRGCKRNGTSTNCGFVPNYPIVHLKQVSQGKSPWKLITDVEYILNKYLDENNTKNSIKQNQLFF